jgi:radical SAM superfamily enzyme YgiQ (UPF0313 family)
MPDIVLATLNAKYIHTSFGLRYLLANLGTLQPRATIREFDLGQRASDIVETILGENPRIVGLGVYIWNVGPTAEVVALLKRLRPDLCVVLGGPEVSFEWAEQTLCQRADYVVTGEADLAFAGLCERLLTGDRPESKVVVAAVPDLAMVALPYACYTEEDLRHRVLYVEASRGCPFTCEFCLSSLDVPVRAFALDRILAEFKILWERGARRFKFVDRTFNLNLAFSRSILEFFLSRICPEMFLHFEMIPDRLPPELRELIVQFPPGCLQFEVGIQSFDPVVSARIRRRQDAVKVENNLRFLKEQTGVHVHADLIVGLPGETLEMFGAGFDRLLALQPQEIQVGILKRLRGTPIVRHDAEWAMVYHETPPYELMQSRAMDFGTMQRLRRFARFWDLLGNSGNFVETTPLLWQGSASPFQAFLALSDWLHGDLGRKHGIALVDLAEKLFRYLTDHKRMAKPAVAACLWRDYQRGGRSDRPAFLRPYLPEEEVKRRSLPHGSGLAPKRQSRHWALPR